MTEWSGRLLLVALLQGAMGCSCDDSESTSPPSPSSSATPSASSSSASVGMRIVTAEHRRDVPGVWAAVENVADVGQRRLAARALARITGKAARQRLFGLLRDADPDVVAWSAYGIGFGCPDEQAKATGALTARAADLLRRPARDARARAALRAITYGLGSCATDEAEATLTAWLALDHWLAELSALALGRVAMRRKALAGTTSVALFKALERDKPVETALFAFTRLPSVVGAVADRLLEVAADELKLSGIRRELAIRALGRGGQAGAELVGAVALDDKAPVNERIQAVQALGRLEAEGQKYLAQVAASVFATVPEAKSLKSAQYGLYDAVLTALRSDNRAGVTAVKPLRAIAVAKGPAIGRRQTALRCRAASLAAGSNHADPKLLSCDPSSGSVGKLAVLDVLDRARVRGGAARTWRELVKSKDAVVRQRSLELIARHDELSGGGELASALGASRGGVVATAADVLAGYPDRAGVAESKVRRQVVEALRKALRAKRQPDDVEVVVSLINAAAALNVLSFKPDVEDICSSSNPTLRRAAQDALRRFGDKKRECDAPAKAKSAVLPKVLPERKYRLEFELDSGVQALTLDPDVAPVTVARLVELAKSGFYNGTSVHRVVPGFVVQFGDPGGDGYGGSGTAPLRCETSLKSFRPLRVGVALSGRDTGSSQLFVTLSRYPHLDGDYPLIGSAQPGWDRVAVGDVIRKVSVRQQ